MTDIPKNATRNAPPRAGRRARVALIMMAIAALTALARRSPVLGADQGSARDRASSRHEERPVYRQLHLREPMTPSTKAALEAAGARILLMVHRDTFLVRLEPAAVERIRFLHGVDLVGTVGPASKLSPGLDARYDDTVRSLFEKAREYDPSPHVAARKDPSIAMPITIVPMEPDAIGAIVERLQSLGASAIGTSTTGRGLVTATVPRAALPALAALEQVLWIERALPAFPSNDVATQIIQSGQMIQNQGEPITPFTPVHNHGLHGEGQIVTVADLGIVPTHAAFLDATHPIGWSHRKIIAHYNLCDPANPGAPCGTPEDGACPNHGTHVAGIVAGDGGTIGEYDGDGFIDPFDPDVEMYQQVHDGQAYMARLQVQDVFGPGTLMPANLGDVFAASINPVLYPQGLPIQDYAWIHTNSWSRSSIAEQGTYATDSMQIDTFVRTHPDLTVLFATKNSSPNGTGSPGTASAESVAKNDIGVGGSLNGSSADALYRPTLRGPTQDGRIKPDLIAPAHGIYSAWGCQYNPGFPACIELPSCLPDSYIGDSGTSMATPMVAAAAALTRQYFMSGFYPRGVAGGNPAFTPSAALIKAMLINSAVEITGDGAYDWGETRYPNNNQGWGRILLDNVLYFQGDSRHLVVADNRNGLITNGGVPTQFYVSSSATPFEATLVWTDYEGTPGGDILVNDLDLTVTAPNGTVYRGNQFTGYNPGSSEPNPAGRDGVNNVEGVLVLSPQTGVWTVAVTGYYIPMAPQTYALVITGANDQDGDGDPDASDCLPANPAVNHSAVDVCNGIDDNCSGVIDEGFPNCDGDAQADCVDPDDDNDGEPDATDCAVCNAAANHNLIEAIPFYGGAPAYCQDGIDNDCDGVVDLDCAIDVDAAGQVVGPGVIVSGTLTNLRATSSQSPTTYEVINESGTSTKKQMTAVWTFTTGNPSGYLYDVAVEAFRNGGSNDDFNVSFFKKSAGQCLATDTGWGGAVITVNGSTDANTVQRAFVGALSPAVVCVRIQDTQTNNDSQVDTLTMDRVYLMPTATCPDADGDGYASSCSNCNNRYCPTVDCDDADALRSPGVVEGPPGYPTCSDGKDNDCDTFVDMADTLSCVPPPPSVLASADAGIGPGRITTPDFTLTQDTDNTWEVSQETIQNNKSKLIQTWRFDNVPNGSNHKLALEAHRNNQADDTFQFYWSTDGTHFNAIPGALVNHPFENEGGQLYPFGAAGQSGTFYIQAKGSNTGTQLDSLFVDFMVILTDP